MLSGPCKMPLSLFAASGCRKCPSFSAVISALLSEKAKLASIVGKLAVGDTGLKAFAEAGAVPPLVELLSGNDATAQTKAAFALGNLSVRIHATPPLLYI